MTILISNNHFMFDVFTLDGHHYLTATTGGVAQFDLTIEVTEQELKTFRADENIAIALATDLVTRTSAYESRLIRPSIDPR